MPRSWKPKYKCVCSVCGWTGKRTMLGINTIPCPKCWNYLEGLSARKKIKHIIAIGKNWKTVKIAKSTIGV